MKKFSIFAILILTGIAAVFFVPGMREGVPELDSTTKSTGLKVREQNHASRPGPPQPTDNPEISIVGRNPYDTGIRNDQRIQQDIDGRNIVMEAVEIARGLHSENLAPEEDLEHLNQLLSFYRLSFERNPVAADNRMVMQALLGNNPEKLVVFPSDHPSLDSTGQLLDRWGTPYFFHPLSGTEMEIFSAGPDKTLNTSDDIAWTNRDGNPLTGKEQTEDDQLNAEP